MTNTPTYPMIGNVELLSGPLLALFCSTRCPASLILQAHDAAHQLVEHGLPVISGFHTPVEQEMLTVLLRGQQPIIYCPARSIDNWRIPPLFRKPLAEGRFLVLSPFLARQPRITAELAVVRNRLVATLAKRVLIIYAAPHSKTATFCSEVAASGKPLYTLTSLHTAHLVTSGVIQTTIEELAL